MSHDWTRPFLDALGDGSTVKAAAAAARAHRSVVYRLKEADADFRNAWERAEARARAAHADASDAHRQALQRIADDPKASNAMRLGAIRELRILARGLGQEKEQEEAEDRLRRALPEGYTEWRQQMEARIIADSCELAMLNVARAASVVASPDGEIVVEPPPLATGLLANWRLGCRTVPIKLLRAAVALAVLERRSDAVIVELQNQVDAIERT